MYLADVSPLLKKSGYGQIGLHGQLGYDGQTVRVGGQTFNHSISAHAPSLLVFELEGCFRRFYARVGLNDDGHGSCADFRVLADGREVASECEVRAGQPPRELNLALGGVRRLSLIVDTNRWERCHSVWLDPELTSDSESGHPKKMIDCLRRAELAVPTELRLVENCIVTVASAGYSRLLYGVLESLRKYAECPDALLAVILVDDDADCERVANIHGATIVRAKSLARRDQTLKAVMYSAARVLPAQRFVCLDADTLVLGSLAPMFEALEACDSNSILVCRDAFVRSSSLLEALCTHYLGKPADIALLLPKSKREGDYKLLVNDGVFAGTRAALHGLDRTIAKMSEAAGWVDQLPNHRWRNQFVLNLALAHLDCGAELDPIYNLQLHMTDIELSLQPAQPRAIWQGRSARILHFCGWGRDKYPELRQAFAEPLTRVRQ
jgi:hypothetical protein